MYNIIKCGSDIGNTGKQKFCGRKGQLLYPVLVPKGAEIATADLALLAQTWIDNFNAEKANRWLPIFKVIQNDATQDDTVIQDFDSGHQEQVRPGNKSSIYILEQISVYNKRELNKLNDIQWDIYWSTDEGNILGWSSDGVLLQPYSTDFVEITPETDDSGSENGHVSMAVKYTDVRQWNLLQAMIQPQKLELPDVAWYPSLVFKGITDLQAIATNATATGCTLELKSYSSVPYDGADGVPTDVYLALASDTDTLIPITTIVSDGAGTGKYTVVWPVQTAEDYLIGLIDQPATTPDFETPVKGELTIA